MVPPLTDDVAVPVEPPLQLTLEDIDAIAVSVAGWVMFTDEVEEQPLVSLTVSV